jgi:Raf kinase inhibitor-like YbhB/YbcL family protein
MPSSPSNYETMLVRAPLKAKGKELAVISESFNDGDMIGMDHVSAGCGGKNRSPQLSWSGAPEGTKSFAITCFDPDAPTGSGYWHWLAWGIPASVASLEVGAGTGQSPAGGRGGYGDSGMTTYDGPCPPTGDGAHRYMFTVYALDVPTLERASEKTTGASVVFKMRGHVLASGSLMGRFGH